MSDCLATIAEATVAVATGILAFFTYRLACEARKTMLESREASFRQIGVQTWLTLEQRFDSVEMKRARKKLAQQLKIYSPNKHDKISETVLNFFESVGIAYKLNYLDKKLADSSFGFHASRWWEAAKSYVDQEQKRHNEDDSLFKDFRDFAELMRRSNEKIDADELRRFFDDEEKLILD